MLDLHKIVEKGDINSLKSLIEEKNINIDEVDNDGTTAIHSVAYFGWKEIVEYLCNNGAKVNLGNNNGYNPLMVASREGYLDIVKILLQNGADVNQIDNDGFTALIMASAFSTNTEIIKELIKVGANIDHTTHTGGSPLLWATWYGMTENVRYLIEKSANKDLGLNGKSQMILLKKRGSKK